MFKLFIMKYYIEEIIKYNDEISIYKLIYRKIKFKWWQFIIFGILLLSIIFFLKFIYKEYYWLSFLPFSFFIASFVLTISILRKGIKTVISKHYQYALNENGDYNYKSFLEIQKVQLVNLMGEDLIKKGSLLFLIDKLTLSSQRNTYSYIISINVILITVGIFTGGFFPKFLDFAKDYRDFKTTSKLLVPVIMLYFFLFITIDRFIIKDIVLKYKNDKSRIVKTLENIYLDRYVE